MLIPSGEEAKKKKGGESKRWPHKRIGLVRGGWFGGRRGKVKGRRQTWRALTTTVFVFPFSFGLFYLHFTSFFVCLGAGTPIPKGYIVQQEKKKG